METVDVYRSIEDKLNADSSISSEQSQSLMAELRALTLSDKGEFDRADIMGLVRQLVRKEKQAEVSAIVTHVSPGLADTKLGQNLLKGKKADRKPREGAGKPGGNRPARQDGERRGPPRGERAGADGERRGPPPRGERAGADGERRGPPRGERAGADGERRGPPRGERAGADGERRGPPRGERAGADGERRGPPRGERAGADGERRGPPRGERAGADGERRGPPRGERAGADGERRGPPPRGERAGADGERRGPPRGERAGADGERRGPPRGERAGADGERRGPPRGERAGADGERPGRGAQGQGNRPDRRKRGDGPANKGGKGGSRNRFGSSFPRSFEEFKIESGPIPEDFSEVMDVDFAKDYAPSLEAFQTRYQPLLDFHPGYGTTDEEHEMFLRRLRWGHNFYRFVRFMRTFGAATAYRNPNAPESEQVLKIAGQINERVIMPDMSDVLDNVENGRSISIIGVHQGYHWLNKSAKDLIKLPRVHITKSGAAEPIGDDIVFKAADANPTAFLKLIKDIRKRQVLIELHPDGRNGDLVRRPMFDSQVDIGKGFTTLTWHSKAALYSMGTNWDGENFRIEVKKEPDPTDFEESETFTEAALDSYVEIVKTAYLENPENLRLPRLVSSDG